MIENSYRHSSTRLLRSTRSWGKLADQLQRICRELYYHPTRSKASILRSPALRYVHTLLWRTLMRCCDSTSIVSTTDFLYLCAMTKHVPLHLGYTVVLSITHQASKDCIRVLYAGPHITRLVRRMSKLWDTKKLELLARHYSPWHGDSSFHEDGRPSTDSQGTSLHPGWH